MCGNPGTFLPRRFRRIRVGCVSVGLGLLVAGCTPAASFQPNRDLLNGGGPLVYSDQDWAAVLRDYVHGGMVNYTALAAGRTPLDRYYALLSETGPSRTPDQFLTSADATAYWINAYNAAVLLFVLEHYPTDTIYDEEMPQIEAAIFRLNGRVYTLPQMEAKLLQVSRGDVRTLFATNRGALGAPQLPPEPIRGATLEQQLAQAAADALDNMRLLRIDSAQRQILVWQVVLARRNDFEQYYGARHGVTPVSLTEVLADLASPRCRSLLEAAAAYTVRIAPFSAQLNDCSTRATPGGRPIVP